MKTTENFRFKSISRFDMKNSIFLVILVTNILFNQVSAQNPSEKSQNSDYQTEENILYRSAEEASKDDYIGERCRLDIYYPAGVKDYATVVWFHGGGITGGNKFIPEQLKDKGIAVVAANYRLSPGVSSPAYIEDAAAALAWTFRNIKKYGGNPDKIVVSGHSAGGYLASMIGLDKKWLEDYQVDANKIAMLVPFSGHTITHFTIRDEQGLKETQPLVDELAPLYHVRLMHRH